MCILIQISTSRDEDFDYEVDDEYAGEQHGGGEGEAPRGYEDEEFEEDSDEEVYYVCVCVYCNFRLWGCICTQSMFAMFAKLKLNGKTSYSQSALTRTRLSETHFQKPLALFGDPIWPFLVGSAAKLHMIAMIEKKMRQQKTTVSSAVIKALMGIAAKFTLTV
ncbi:MAG: hypothetical protein EZS28_035815 [Streblomastix strix]|uniref:Uncharacterized protein n=1 Tax=Streblomastix strix TaxID=222440 RepID=A0A5J4UDH4_9EUKA|nr:MAG: hypothetical protein EZS28_035815 [Streblomastix strix]